MGKFQKRKIAKPLILKGLAITFELNSYPEPGSNRHGLPHWCLRPARLPIPPSGLLKRCKDRQEGGKYKVFRFLFFSHGGFLRFMRLLGMIGKRELHRDYEPLKNGGWAVSCFQELWASAKSFLERRGKES